MQQAMFWTLLLACAKAPEGRQELLDHDAWTVVDGDCEPEVVDPVLELETDGCESLTVTQNTRHDVFAGDRVRVIVYHDLLFGEGTATMDFDVAGITSISIERELPHDATHQAQDIEIIEDVPAGAKVTWSVTDPGEGVWSVLLVDRIR